MDPVLKRLSVFFPLAFVFSWYSFVLFHLGVPRATGGIVALGKSQRVPQRQERRNGNLD